MAQQQPHPHGYGAHGQNHVQPPRSRHHAHHSSGGLNLNGFQVSNTQPSARQQELFLIREKMAIFESLVGELAQVEAEIRDRVDAMAKNHEAEVQHLQAEVMRLRHKYGEGEDGPSPPSQTLHLSSMAMGATRSEGENGRRSFSGHRPGLSNTPSTTHSMKAPQIGSPQLSAPLSTDNALARSSTERINADRYSAQEDMLVRSSTARPSSQQQRRTRRGTSKAMVPPPPSDPHPGHHGSMTPTPHVPQHHQQPIRHVRTSSAPQNEIGFLLQDPQSPPDGTAGPGPMRDQSVSMGFAEHTRQRSRGMERRSLERIDLLNGVAAPPPPSGGPPGEEGKRQLDIELPANELSEREFYKKYWIEAGKIGEGAFSRIRRITRKEDKKVFALKMIKKRGKSKSDIAALQKEIFVLQRCNHRNIVKLLDWSNTKKRIYMVVEFCEGGDVFERVVQMKKFSERDAAHVIQQVASGLAHLHERGFIHRDLKPDNLMYLTRQHDSEIKIIDFGLAGIATDGPCTTPCGTAHYAAPEVLSSTPYTVSADIWSLGVILYTLLCGFPPFFDANNNLKNLYHLIKKAKYAFPSPFWDDISANAKDLVKKCLVKEPQQRLTAPQVLIHPWLSEKQASNTQFSARYIEQMQHWQSTRHETEMALGEEREPTNKNIDLYAQNWGQQ